MQAEMIRKMESGRESRVQVHSLSKEHKETEEYTVEYLVYPSGLKLGYDFMTIIYNVETSCGSELSNQVCGDAQDLVTVSCSIEAHLVELAAFPVGIEVSQPLVHLQVMEGDVGEDFLLDD